MKKSLFTLSFTYIFISIIFVVIILSTVFFFSIRRSVTAWNVNQGQRLENLILPMLTQVYREKGHLSEISIHRKISPFLTSSVFTYVFNKNRKLIYIYSYSSRVPLYNKNLVNEALDRLRDRSRPLTPILSDGDIIGYLAADTLGFAHDVANRQFLKTVFSFMAWGAIIALLVAVIASLIFSKFLSNQARSLAAGLKKLSQGHRHVDFPSQQAEEMNDIAETANYLQNKLQEEEKLRRQWAEDVAHDLRTPVSALKVQLEGLADGVFNPTGKKLKALYHESGRIESLVEDLRELNKVESPEMQIDREKIEIPSFIDNIIESTIHSSSLTKRYFSVKCNVKWCNADRHYLHRALSNVIKNAIDYMENDGSIKIYVFKENKYTVFDISNTGFINQENASRYFQRLYKETTSRSTAGSGLGLPITLAVMQQHGGKATLEQHGNKTHAILTLYDPH